MTGAASAAAPPATAPIRAGSEYDYPPFALTTSKGEAGGFSVELLRAALEAMGREVEFKVGPWHILKTELAEGKLQVLPLVARTPERDRLYDFTVPYLTMHGSVVVRKGSSDIRGAADLKGRRVVVMRGDIAEEYVTRHRLTDKISTTESLEQALLSLSHGEYEAVVVQKLAGQQLINALGLNNLEIVGPPLADYQEFCFAVKEGDKELLSILNEGLALVIADGTFERLQKKWLGPLQEGRLPYLQMIGVALVTLLLAWVIAYLWQRSLRDMVKARTRELRESNESLAGEVAKHQRTQQELQRKSEELEAMFLNLHLCIAVADREFNYIRVNAAFAAASGRSIDFFRGINAREICRNDVVEEMFEQVVRSAAPLVANGVRMGSICERNDAHRYWDLMLAPLKDRKGGVEGVLITAIDATERELHRREAEEAWRQANAALEQRVRERTADLEEANRELESFSYSVSHDLRAPLRAINGFTDIIEQDFHDTFDEEARGYMARIRAATVRMSELIDGLLNLARVFRSDLQPAEVMLSEMAEEIVRMLRESTPNREVQVRVEPGISIRGDPRLLRVLMQNLLGNAWKFTSRLARAEIEFGREMGEEREVFYVRDNGVGFEMKYAHKLFRSFERLHQPGEYEGTGIGLATVRRIVLRHGGEVWARGEPNRGATIYFTLPAMKRELGVANL